MLIIIPDIHGRDFWKKPINDVIENRLNVDKIIFLGDYFDPYKNEGITEENAIRNWLDIKETVVDKLPSEKYVFLIGNHDAHYMNDIFCRLAGGSRMSVWNKQTIKGILQDNRFLFKIAHEETVGGKRFLFTHAGVNNEWLERHRDLLPSLNERCLNNLSHSDKGWEILADIGHIRGGYQATGSPLWSDAHEHLESEMEDEKSSIENYDYQIFGHTQQKDKPLIKNNYAMLDCRKPFLLTDDGVIREA